MDWQGWFLPRGLTQRKPKIPTLTPPAEEDLEKLRALRAAGSKMDLPHPVRCFLLFDSEEGARAAADMLQRENTPSTVRARPDGRWTLTVVQHVVPEPRAITKIRETLTAAAEAQDGRFLEWTAPLVY